MENIDDLEELCIMFSDTKQQATLVYNSLSRGSEYFHEISGIHTIEDLKKTSMSDISKIRRIGETSIRIIEKMKASIQ